MVILSKRRDVKMPTSTDFFKIKVKDLSEKPFDLNSLKGKVTLIVNTASKCGYTVQYKELQELYDKYKGDGLQIIGVPCNQFGGQEPGTAEEIENFCEMNFGVRFPLLSKLDVNGENRHELYNYLISNSGSNEDIKWNFEKFLIDKQGNVIDRFKSSVKPLNSELETKIVKELKK